jgi:hypothetical protein
MRRHTVTYDRLVPRNDDWNAGAESCGRQTGMFGAADWLAKQGWPVYRMAFVFPANGD